MTERFDVGIPQRNLPLTAQRRAKGIGATIEQLNARKPAELAWLHLVLATNGFFTKKSRPIAERAARKVLARFKNAKLTSVHPT